MKNKLMRLIALAIVLSTLCGLSVACSSNNEHHDKIETDDKEPTGVDEDGMKYTTVSLTDSGLAITTSFDVNGHITSMAYTREEFASVAKTMVEDGFNRVYVVTTRAGIPAASSASNQWNDPGDTPYKISDSLILSGDPNFEFLYACHKEGLEVIAVYKPYEGGGVSKGGDADLSNSLYYEDTVGGYWTGYDTFISTHPELRLSRKGNAVADAIKNDVITKIDASFILDGFIYKTWGGDTKRVSAVSDDAVIRPDIKLYVSTNNLDYVEYSGNYNMSFKIEKKPFYDENGWAMFDSDVRTLVATISGIEIGSEYQYLALTLANKHTGSTYTVPQSMIRIYNQDGEALPTTVGYYVRYVNDVPVRPDNYKWGAESVLAGTDEKALDYFQSWGFEFDWYGKGINNTVGFNSSYVYGIARGNFEYAKGTLCEAYPEVQEYWLSEVKNLLTMGYDGIEVRLQAHSFMISDYAYYGFNEPLMEAYVEKYGEDPRNSDTVSKETAYRIACLRGDYFMQFLTEASNMVHESGKIFGCQMRSGMIDMSMDAIMNTTLHKCFGWPMPKIVFDWKAAIDLCDTITIKENFFNNYSASSLKEMTDYAVEKNVPVWITAYLSQSKYWDENGKLIGDANTVFFNNVAKDENVYGIQIYEYTVGGRSFQYAFEKLKEELNYIPREVE